MGLPVGTHDNFVPISVNMALAEGKRLRQHVIACAHKVNEEHFVVLDETEDSLVVVACSLGAKRNNDPLRGIRLHHALRH